MKSSFLKQVLTAFVAGLVLTATANADFARTKTYAEGQFADVTSAEWYAESVKDAYEYGIMQGNSANTFNPIGTLTVAEGVTISARLYETISGVAIKPATGGEWYQQYVDYCVEQGVFAADKFDSYTRTIRRSEMAELMAAVSGNLPEINTVTKLPDVPFDAEYAESVFKLYRAGILTGNDTSGTFGPESELKRSEISAMAVRIADSSKRKNITLAESALRPYYDAYSIIDVENASLGRNGLANGWNYDYRFKLVDTTGRDSNFINDGTDEAYGSLKRDFDPEYAGVLKLDTFIRVKSEKGCAYLAFQNNKFENVVSIEEKDGKWALVGKETVVSNIAVPNDAAAQFAVEMTVDLDKNTAMVVINNILVGTVAIDDSEVSRLELGCRKLGTGYVLLDEVHLNKNYSLYERFFALTAQAGQKPATWNVTGDFGMQKIVSLLGTDLYSMKAETKAGNVSTAQKSFDVTGGKIHFETFVLFPEKVDGASVSLTSAGNDVLKFETKNGKIVMGDKVIHEDYTANVWHLLYVEADTRTGKALVKINGKEKATVDFYVPYFDGVKINFAPDKDAVMWFDDVKVSHIIDHADYPSYPKVAASDNFNVGINVCWLWRDSNSMEGWDATSPFSEFDPYLGFYDEGLRETADWEIKWMAEHGIDFLHACWYAPQSDMKAPIKQWRVSYGALHDGYMNAKYSDLVDFCIMWETGYKGCSSIEGFYNYLWPYWKEYYFADDRYARLDNKAVLTIWSTSAAATCLGGEDKLKEALQFMDAELKKMGYDGLIVLFSTTGLPAVSTYEKMASYGVDAATYGYHWNEAGASASHQISCNTTNTKNALAAGSHHIPTVSVGFNDVARNESRADVISFSGHLSVCEKIKSDLENINTGTWRDNTVMISTWNEFSEGTYVFPVEQCGFNYLENVRKVFTNDTSDHSEIDVKPTTAQVDRVGHLYPPNHSPIRWLQLEGATTGSLSGIAGVIVPSELDVIKRFDLKDEFKVSHSIVDEIQESNLFKGTGTNVDFGICTTGMQPVSTERATVIHIKMKTDSLANGEIFFRTDISPSYDGKKMKTFVHSENGADENGYVDYYIDMSKTSGWNGNLAGIRIDPCTKASGFEIVLIELLGNAEVAVAKDATVLVNNKQLGFTFVPVFTEDGDIVAVGEARKGFYSMLGLYHEYDRFTGNGVLKLYTRENKEIVFSVGSDKVLVDGKEENLGYTFELRDGLPMFRLKKLLELIGYEYTIEDSTISIEACDDDVYEMLMNAKPNWFEFNIDGDIEGFTCQHTSLSQANGRLIGAGLASAQVADPAVMKAVNFDSTLYGKCVVGMLYTPLLAKSTPQLFFSNDTGFTAAKCVNGKYDLTGKGEGDIVEITFDLRSNTKYSGIIKNIRFDPFGAKEEFQLDYIRFIESNIEDEVAEKYTLYKKIDLKKEVILRAVKVEEQNADVIKGVSENSDPAVTLNIPAFPAENVSMVKVTVSASADSNMQVYFITQDDTEWNESKGTSTSVKASSGMRNYYINIGANSKWTGTIKTLRIDPVSHNGLNFTVESIELLSANNAVAEEGSLAGVVKTEEPKTEEPKKETVRDWSAYTLTKFDIEKLFVQNDGFTTYKATGESFTGLSKHEDPMIQTKGALGTPVVAANAQYVVAKIKSDKNTYARIYFLTDTSGNWSEDKGVSATIKASDEPVEVVFDMSKVATWNGNITQIRLDPVGIKDCNIEVEYFGYYTK